METIRKSNVPYYLRNGSLYSALDDDENGPFEVPSECFKSSLQMNSLEDLRFVLRSLRYWGVIEFPQEVYRYMFLSVDRPVVERLKMREFSEFENQLNGISAMLAVAEKDVDRQRLVTSFNIYDTLQSVNGPMDAAVVCDFGLEMVKWLHQRHHTIGVAFPRAATADSHLDILRYFVEEVGCEKEPYMTVAAVLSGSLESLKYLLKHNFHLHDSSVSDACYHNQPHILEFLLQRGLPFEDTDAAYYAVKRGHMRCVELLCSAGCAFDLRTVAYAVRVGNLECLMYLHQNNLFSMTDSSNRPLCEIAARSNHLSCLQYLHERSCPWDQSTVDSSMESFECLKYAHVHGCPWGQTSPHFGDLKCLAYVVLHGPLQLWVRHLLFTFGVSFVAVLPCYMFAVSGSLLGVLGSVVFWIWAAGPVVLGWVLFVLYFYLRHFSKE